MMPVRISTLSLWIILSASWTAISGFWASSSMTSSMSLLPDCLIASTNASRMSTPRPAPPPDSVVITPILTGSAIAMPEAAIDSARMPPAMIFLHRVLPPDVPVIVVRIFRTRMELSRDRKTIQPLPCREATLAGLIPFIFPTGQRGGKSIGHALFALPAVHRSRSGVPRATPLTSTGQPKGCCLAWRVEGPGRSRLILDWSRYEKPDGTRLTTFRTIKMNRRTSAASRFHRDPASDIGVRI